MHLFAKTKTELQGQTTFLAKRTTLICHNTALTKISS